MFFDEHKSWDWNDKGKKIIREQSVITFPSYGGENEVITTDEDGT